MKVAIFGKEGCALCVGAKDKLARLGIEFTYHDLKAAAALHEGWREDGTVEVLAGWAAINNYTPLIMIDGKPYCYEEFVSIIKAKQYVETVENAPELPTVAAPDKVLVLESRED